mmetsp:Transcript_48249/g.90303  ORF Transcript_48249/g.90303 Transcript_48249/m.90303 type:complete len:181 (-) Transcript_48249:19-561(-)
MNKFHDMMGLLSARSPGFAQVVAVDAEFMLFTRAWCVAEIHKAQQMGTPQRMRIFSEANLQEQQGWLHELKVQEMKASNLADIELILSKIDDKERFNAELQSLIFGKDGLISTCNMGFERMSILGKVAQRGADRVKTQSFIRGGSCSRSTDATDEPSGGHLESSVWKDQGVETRTVSVSP